MPKILSIIYQTKKSLDKNSIKTKVINNINKVFNSKTIYINSIPNKLNIRYQQTDKLYYYYYKTIKTNRRIKNVN